MDHHEILPQLEALHHDAFGWAAACCGGDAHRAEDILQVAYAKVLGGSVRYGGRSAFKTWWFGVIRFTALEEMRRSRRWLAFLDRWRAEPTIAEEPVFPNAETDDELAALAAALRNLSDRQRQVLHLTFYQGLSLSEAAEVMEITIGSARQHYDRGKRHLREILQTKRALHE